MTNRKPRMNNQELIDLLNTHVTGGAAQFCKKFTRTGRLSWYKRQSGYTNKQDSYYIPMDVYNEVTGKKFNPKLKLGTMVRIRKSSSRRRPRGVGKQDVGDTYSFANLGMGTGKAYPLEFEHKVLEQQSKENYLEMNGYYACNLRSIEDKLRRYGQRGWKILTQEYMFENQTIWQKQNHEPRYLKKCWRRHYLSTPAPKDFIKTKRLVGTGILGNKKLINGYVTDIFIHFQFPEWTMKRESRFEITFETGAKVIFTDDFLEKVYDTDYDCDEAIYYCSHSGRCGMPICDHKQAHALNHECHEGCNFQPEARCEVLYDYTNIGETTVGKGILDDEE